MIKSILEYLNPIKHLGDRRYNLFFPFITTILSAVILEFIAYRLTSNPENVSNYAIAIFFGLIIYFSLREGIKGGYVVTVITILYYYYIVYTRHYTGTRFITSIQLIVLFMILYFFLSTVIGWLKEIVDVHIENEVKENKRLRISINQLKELDQRKEDFINTASHELRTPLTSVLLYLELLERHVKSANLPKIADASQHLGQQLQRLERLVSDLLDVSRLQTGKLSLKLSPFRLDQLLMETVELANQTHKGEPRIHLKANKPISVVADRFRIYQVLTNLIGNSLKYSPPNSQIEVGINRGFRSVVIFVRDQGKGIPRQDQKRIFDRLYQVRDPSQRFTKGFGMGLFICKQIVEQHGGKIWLKSEPNKGSIFYFRLRL